jgi:hypothetical protein
MNWVKSSFSEAANCVEVAAVPEQGAGGPVFTRRPQSEPVPLAHWAGNGGHDEEDGA